MARRRQASGDPINGILLLDKSLGISSNTALQQAKRLFKAQKAGHTGSLDPLASGLLPVCFGFATRISPYLLESDKRYHVRIRLGIKTSSGDAEGAVIEDRPVPDMNRVDIENILVRFKGEIEQIPPMYSALKKDGVPLYKLARKGISIERAARKINIYELNFQGLPEPGLLELDVLCSKGTYIRTLAEDIGEAIGCGAHVATLRRTQVGDFKLDAAFCLDDLQSMQTPEARLACLLPMDQALLAWPSVPLSEAQLFYLQQGQAVLVDDLPVNGLVRLYGASSEFAGIGEVRNDSKLAPIRMFIK